ncbi:MAG: OmpA family protein [Bacteroidia bacterium]
MRSKGFISLITVLLCTTWLGAQNLIRNGNFEEFSDFENYDFGYKALENNVTTWRPPTQGQTKIFSDEQTSLSGKAFVGIHTYGIKNYREYLTTPLNCRLIEGESYIFKMYVKLSRNSEFAVSSFGVSFSNERPDAKTTGVLNDSTQILVDNKAFYDDKRAWILIEDSFIAKGNEAYLTIGNFLDDESTVSKKVVRMAREGRAYYYIDNVSLESKNGHDPCKAILDSFDCEDVTLSDYNLLNDPSFECYSECPSNVNTTTLHQLEYWDQTLGTPDYYNSCSIIMSVPDNIMGNEQALTGYGYVGMYLFDKGNYREFLTAKLTEPLEKNQYYVISLYAALSENSGLATDAFEFLITKKYPDISDQDSSIVLPDLDTTENFDPNITSNRDTSEFEKIRAEIKEVKKDEGKMLEGIKPSVINAPNNYGDSYSWKKICGLYFASGGEKYITLGNFNSDTSTNLKIMNPKAGGFAYYYIDDFTVELRNDSNESECGANIPVDEEEELITTRYFQDLDLAELLNDEPFTFKGFYFEFDRYEILDTNYFFLDSLIDLLFENPDLDIEVHGHTDNMGSNRYNNELSKNRAQTVVEYLISEGIDKKRIKMEYFGATKPVATNSTSEGQQLNRRCEFIIKR